MKPGAALITGGGRRLGRAIALDLASQGWDLAIHHMASADAAAEVAELARAKGVRAETLQADLLDDAAVASLLPRTAVVMGRAPTLLINNASVFEPDSIQNATLESWDRHLGSNLKAPFFLTQAFAAMAPEVGRDAAGEPVAQAAIVNMIDMRVRKLSPDFATYTLAKMGLWALTRTAAQALAPAVRVNGIGPGPTLQGARQRPEHFAAQRAATVLERGSSPEEICAALRFILAADGLTGQLLCMDGGQHLMWQTPDHDIVE
ncbi:MAG: SDR family oxidoreductase [Pseudomonadota bacterium]